MSTPSPQLTPYAILGGDEPRRGARAIAAQLGADAILDLLERLGGEALRPAERGVEIGVERVLGRVDARALVLGQIVLQERRLARRVRARGQARRQTASAHQPQHGDDAHRASRYHAAVDRSQLYERVGGEPGVRALVDRFYDLMDTLPEAHDIRALHPPMLDSSRDKLFWFLVGWLGGPPLYMERFGHPRLRARHLPFAIGARERDQWMMCMTRAIDERIADAEVRAVLAGALAPLADHMRNRAE